MMQNDLATCQQIGTELTRGCSADVRTALLEQRRKLGADTPAGRRCSNLDEMLQNREKATGDHLARLNASIAIQARELADLVTKGERG